MQRQTTVRIVAAVYNREDTEEFVRLVIPLNPGEEWEEAQIKPALQGAAYKLPDRLWWTAENTSHQFEALWAAAYDL